jgi:hypothetical protein
MSFDMNAGDDYFNDLRQAMPNSPNRSPVGGSDPRQPGALANRRDTNECLPRPKRIACVICRKRKLRCDSEKPSCGTCARLGHDCAYDEVRRKSGPKRGYVKALEARLGTFKAALESCRCLTHAS